MNGVHDMGGDQGMGPVRYEKDEPVFHARWEGRIYALNRSMRARRKWSLDTDRHRLELMPPVDYLQMSYYERWVVRLESQLLTFGFVTPEEKKSGRASAGSAKAKPALTLETAFQWLNRGIAASQDPSVPPKFQAGQRIRARNINPVGHTRLPKYARGKTGIIARDHGVYDFPDTKAHFQGEKRQHVYSVQFSARELWGKASRATIPSTSTCGMTTLSGSDSMHGSERVTELPRLSRDEGGPVFAEPWQAQVFALAVRLSAQGHFTWKEWATTLADELKAGADRGEPDDGSYYYVHWLAALERLVTAKRLTDRDELLSRKDEWADAYRHTPHGKPVELRKA